MESWLPYGSCPPSNLSDYWICLFCSSGRRDLVNKHQRDWNFFCGRSTTMTPSPHSQNPHSHSHSHPHHITSATPNSTLSPTSSSFYLSLLFSIFISLLSLVGLFLLDAAPQRTDAVESSPKSPPQNRQLSHSPPNSYHAKLQLFFHSFAIGSLLSDVVFHLLSHSNPNAVFVAIMLSFILDLYLHSRVGHNHDANNSSKHYQNKKSSDAAATAHVQKSSSTSAVLNIISDGVHNLMDGSTIAVSFMFSTRVGILTSLSIILHELPQEISDYYILRRAGWSKTKALTWNFISALLCVVGTLLGWRFITESLQSHAVGFTTGCFLYLVLTDMIPDLKVLLHQRQEHHHPENKTKSPVSSKYFIAFGGIGAGVFLIYIAEYVEHQLEAWM